MYEFRIVLLVNMKRGVGKGRIGRRWKSNGENVHFSEKTNIPISF